MDDYFQNAQHTNINGETRTQKAFGQNKECGIFSYHNIWTFTKSIESTKLTFILHEQKCLIFDEFINRRKKQAITLEYLWTLMVISLLYLWANARESHVLKNKQHQIAHASKIK